MANNETSTNCETLLLHPWVVSHETNFVTILVVLVVLLFFIYALWIAVNRMLCVLEHLLSNKNDNESSVDSYSWNGGIHRIMLMAILNVSPIIINCFLVTYKSIVLHDVDERDTETSLLIVLAYGFFLAVLGLSGAIVESTKADNILLSLRKSKSFWCLFIGGHVIYIWLLLILRGTGIHLTEAIITLGLFPILYFNLWLLERKFNDTEISPLVLTNSQVEVAPPAPNQGQTSKVVRSIAYYREAGLKKRLGVSYRPYNVNDSYIDTIKSSIMVKHNENDTVGTTDWIKHVLTIPGKLITAAFTIPPVWNNKSREVIGILSVNLCFVLVTLIVILISDISLQLTCYSVWTPDLTALIISSLWYATPDMATSIQIFADENADSFYTGYPILLSQLVVFFGLGLNWILNSMLTSAGSSLDLKINITSSTFYLILFWVSSIITTVIIGVTIKRQAPANNKFTKYSIVTVHLLTLICALIYAGLS